MKILEIQTRNLQRSFIVTNMKTPNDFNIQTVYSYANSNDLKNYYNDWAHEYEDYTNQVNYILPQKVAEIFSLYSVKERSIVLDIGCGTGLLGYFLSKINTNLWIEGIDISRSMTQIALSKARPNFKPVYDWIVVEDFKSNKLLLDNYYDAITSAGTFTNGHLNSSDLIKLLSYLKNNGIAVVSIKEDHFYNENFEKVISELKEKQIINDIEYHNVNSYDSSYEAKSIVVKFTKV